MRTLILAIRIWLAAVLLTFLMWFPGKTLGLESGWSPPPCFGQGGAEPNPENIVIGSYAGNDFTGRVVILNNAIIDATGFHTVHILNSFYGFTGIAQVNQAGGVLNNQMTHIGVAGSPGGAQITNLRMNYLSKVQGNSLTTLSNTYQAHIKGASFALGSGVALVNQAAGHMNVQLNAFHLAIGNQAAEHLTDIQMCAISCDNTLSSDPEAFNIRATELELDNGAFQDFTGIWSTSQIAGNMNQVTTLFNIRVKTVP